MAIKFALKYDPLLVPAGGQEVVGEFTSPRKAPLKEPAGHAFNEAALLAAGVKSLDIEEESKDSGGSGDESDTQSPARKTSWDEEPKKKKKKKKGESEDLYELLGLGDDRYLASEKQIKDAYRDTALKYHPDKCGALKSDEEKVKIEERFKLIQEAYEVLSDPVRRREYDSKDEFDDSLPSSATPETFCKTFGAAFRRNAKWSEISPVPQLGDDSTSYEEVEKFYDFWFKFKSWREFPQDDEFELDTAECREHKRWMERQNAKAREKAKKEDQRRLRNFIELAYGLDPRISKQRELEREEKEAKKRAKHEERRKKEEEALAAQKAEEEEKAKADAEAKNAKDAEKKQREKEKKLVRKERSRFRTIVSDLMLKDIPEDLKLQLPDIGEVENICSGMEYTPFFALNNKLAPEPVAMGAVPPEVPVDECVELVREAMASIGLTLKTKKSVEELGMASCASPKPAASPVPSPASPSPGAKGSKGKKGGGSSTSPSAEAGEAELLSKWSDEDVRMLEKALRKFPKGTARRWEVIANYLRTHTQDEIIAMCKSKYMQGHDGAKGRSQDAVQQFLKDKQAHMAKGLPKDSAPPTQDSENEKPDHGDAGELENGNKVEDSKEQKASDEWTPAQEHGLVQAVKAFPKGCAKTEKERWARIATAVPGKTSTQCYKHMPVMLAKLRASKGES